MLRPGAPGIYVHVPFCARVCPYCDFAVQTGGPKRREQYVGALREEIRRWGEVVARGDGEGEAAGGGLAEVEPGTDSTEGQHVTVGAGGSTGEDDATPGTMPAWPAAALFDTVYMGGGTPSSLAPDQLDAILTSLRAALPVESGASITLEANPEDVTPESVAAWRALGVATLSLGVQSFDAGALRFLGREHGPELAVSAVETARAAGFETVSLDLIFGLPRQDEGGWRADLERAVALRPDHVSCYELTIHESTPFGRRSERGEVVVAGEERRADLFVMTHELLAAAGYPAYEVSNFAAAPRHRSRHNRKYWRHAPYLGLGPSAHSYDGRARRWWNRRRLSTWQETLEAGPAAGLPIAGAERLGPADLVLEALALGLRTTAGVDLGALHRRWGIDLLAANEGRIDALQRGGLLELRPPARLVPTLRGLAVADALARELDVPAAG